MQLILTILEVLASFAIAAVGAHFLGQVVITYQVTSTHLEIVLLGLVPLFCIPLRDADVKRLTHRDYLTSPDGYKYLWIMNRLFAQGYVLIHRRSGIFRYIVLSPSHPDDFIEKLVAGGAEKNQGQPRTPFT
jgi:hypothetical protein